MEATCPHERRAMRRAWKAAWSQAATLSPTDRALLEALYAHLGERLQCWPSQETLALRVGVSARTVRRRLAALEQQGWIQRLPQLSARGRLTDNYLIGAPDGVIAARARRPRARRRGQGCLDMMTREKDQEEKASEPCSSAAAAAAETPTAAAPRRPTQLRCRCRRRQSTDHRSFAMPCVGSLLRLWEELIQAPAPSPGWLSHHSAAELQTAFALLLVRRRGGEVRSYRGLFLRLLAAVHAGERPPQRYSDDTLRAIAGGLLPEHARGVPRRDAPSHDVATLPDSDETPTPSAAHAATASGLPAHIEASLQAALALARGTSPDQWEGACEALLAACQEGVTHELHAAEALAVTWGWSVGAALGTLHQVKRAATTTPGRAAS
jgi:hypothetical protein